MVLRSPVLLRIWAVQSVAELLGKQAEGRVLWLCCVFYNLIQLRPLIYQFLVGFQKPCIAFLCLEPKLVVLPISDIQGIYWG